MEQNMLQKAYAFYYLYKVVRIFMNVLNFKNKEDYNKLKEQIRPIILFL